MKQITAIFLCLLFGAMAIASAQGVKVSVLNDAEEPLPHAYIYVNERAVAVADDMGMAVIPLEKLQLGDTISISYVGTEGQSVAVDQNLLTKGEYQFVLPEIYAMLRSDAVIVKANLNVKKHYRKHVKRRSSYIYTSIWTTDFSMNISEHVDSVRMVDGKLKIAKARPYQISQVITSDPKLSVSHAYVPKVSSSTRGGGYFWNALPIEITTLDDTTGLSLTFQRIIVSAFQTTDLSIIFTRLLEGAGIVSEGDAKLTYGYLGKDQHHRIFRLTYLGGESNVNYQILVKCDTESGDIREITSIILNLSNGLTCSIKAKIRAVKIQIAKKGHSVRYVPVELEYKAEYNSGRIINVTMKNIDFEYYPWKDADIKRALKTGKLD